MSPLRRSKTSERLWTTRSSQRATCCCSIRTATDISVFPSNSAMNPARRASPSLHAQDAIALLDHLGLKRVHLVGLVGIGACICQEIAIARPDLARSLLNTGAWCETDDFLRDQLEMFRWVHREAGFLAFQLAVSL